MEKVTNNRDPENWQQSAQKTLTIDVYHCERFEPRSYFKSRLSLIVRVNVVLNRTVVTNRD